MFRSLRDAIASRCTTPVRRLLAGVALIGLGLGVLACEPGAAPFTSGGYETTLFLEAGTKRPGDAVTLSAAVTADRNVTALVDIEVYDGSGTKVFQKVWDQQTFTADETRFLGTTWSLPSGLASGSYHAKVAIFGPGWNGLRHWNDGAATIVVNGSPTTTPPPPSGGFETLPVGASLPSGATCASQVRPAAEVRPENDTPNHRRGSRSNANTATYWSQMNRVDGNFVGTTDEIIQWAACKWGVDEDMVRAQVVKESWWYQSANGDNGESWGLGQVRDTAHPSAFQYSVNARTSSAYNLDYTYGHWRACFEGTMTWLNTVERGRTYAAGDAWGCMGQWFSGRWYTQPALNYIEGGDTNGYGLRGVKDHFQLRTWEDADFLNG